MGSHRVVWANKKSPVRSYRYFLEGKNKMVETGYNQNILGRLVEKGALSTEARREEVYLFRKVRKK